MLDAWEALWAPYDEAVYAATLAAIRPDDIGFVLMDPGCGRGPLLMDAS